MIKRKIIAIWKTSTDVLIFENNKCVSYKRNYNELVELKDVGTFQEYRKFLDTLMDQVSNLYSYEVKRIEG